MPLPDLTGKHALVTGGAGFIGSHLVDALLERGARVTVLDNLSTGSLSNLSRWLPDDFEAVASPPNSESASSPFSDRRSTTIQNSKFKIQNFPSSLLTVLRGDIRDLETCRLACGLIPSSGSSIPPGSSAPPPRSGHGTHLPSPHFVFHHAALCSVQDSLRDPGLYFSVNAAGAANVFTAAHEAGAERVVYATSSAVYGDNGEGPRREGTEKRPVSPYALSKVFNEETADLFSRCYGHTAIGLRYFNIFGPRQSPSSAYAGVIPLFFDAFLRGKAPTIYGDGGQTRDFAFVSDAVHANLLAAVAPPDACGRAYNIAGGNSISIRGLAQTIAGICGSSLKVEHRDPRPGEVRHSLADVTLAREVLGYQPRVPLAEGLAMCLEHYKEITGRR